MELNEPLFYKDDQGGVSAVVGYESHAVRSVRYCFTAPEQGASALALEFEAKPGNGTTPERLLVGFDRETPLGSLTLEGWFYRGSLEALLLPGQTVTLWVFPADTTFGWVWWLREGSVTFSGAAAPDLAAEGGALGTALPWRITPYVAGNHSLRCEFMGETLEIMEDSEELEGVWTPPLSWARHLPGSVQAAARLVVTGTGGEGSTEVMLTVPETVIPRVTAAWEDVSGASAVFGQLVQGCSRLAVTVTAEGSWGSTVESTAVALDGLPYYGTELGTLQPVLSVEVTDSRGRHARWQEQLQVLAYKAPTVSLGFSRCSPEGEGDDGGEYAKLTLTGQVGEGSLVVTLGGSETVLAVSGEFSETLILPAPSHAAHTVTALLTDGLKTARAAGVLSVGYATMDFLAGGRGVALGTTATREGLDCAMPARFSGGIWLTEGVDYGDSLPESLPEGRLFFLRMENG